MKVKMDVDNLVIKSILNKIKSILIPPKKHNWEKVDRVPHWAWKRLDLYSLCTFQYRTVKGKYYTYKAICEDNGGEQGHHRDYNLYRKRRTHVQNENVEYVITPKWMGVFNEQIKWRENVYGIPLPTIQKIKAARAVSHQIFSTDCREFRGYRGHILREVFRKQILKSVGVEYKMQNKKSR